MAVAAVAALASAAPATVQIQTEEMKSMISLNK